MSWNGILIKKQIQGGETLGSAILIYGLPAQSFCALKIAQKRISRNAKPKGFSIPRHRDPRRGR
jgi:hypothetical protein